MQFYFFILLLVLSSLIAAQPIHFDDADSPGAAVGHLRMMHTLSDGLLTECSKHVPNMADELSKNMQIWLKADSSVLRKTDQYFNREAAHDPESRYIDKKVAESAIENINRLAGVSNGEEKVKSFCKAHFEGLANGAYRRLTPNAYRYVEELPELSR